ncbi:nucleoside 2-deoxyribosyltransferase [Streptomyces californicus]|uniref:nucleoside 2-deoxyribosyltransferase n=1 Tax=Streptomyces californicus TaxID=67351 RepID=UPI0035E24E73
MSDQRPVYLAGPIHGCTDSEATDWRSAARMLIRGSVLDPMVRDYRGQEAQNAADIVEGDKADIRNCRAVLAYCPRPSAGTSMEIHYAWSLGLPVVTVVPVGPVSPWLQYHSTGVFRDLAAAVNHLRYAGNHTTRGEPCD